MQCLWSPLLQINFHRKFWTHDAIVFFCIYLLCVRSLITFSLNIEYNKIENEVDTIWPPFLFFYTLSQASLDNGVTLAACLQRCYNAYGNTCTRTHLNVDDINGIMSAFLWFGGNFIRKSFCLLLWNGLLILSSNSIGRNMNFHLELIGDFNRHSYTHVSTKRCVYDSRLCYWLLHWQCVMPYVVFRL